MTVSLDNAAAEAAGQKAKRGAEPLPAIRVGITPEALIYVALGMLSLWCCGWRSWARCR
jgi:hypothetical protein